MKRVIALTGVLFLVACSHERRIEDVAYNVSVDENPGQQILALEERISTARKNQVDLLSPTWFESAVISLNQAKAVRDSNGDVNNLYREVAEGNEQLKRAVSFADISRKELSDVIARRDAALMARRGARGAGAARLGEIQDQFEDADDKFMDLTKAVEDGRVGDITNDKVDVMKHYAVIETMSVKKEKLDTARRVVDQAIREGARNYAPRTLASAQQSLKAAESFINNSPTNEKAIDEKSTVAVFDANRALNITREAKKVADRRPEETVLWVEEVIVGLGSDVGAPDSRDRRFDEQLGAIKDGARGLRSQDKSAGRNIPFNPDRM